MSRSGRVARLVAVLVVVLVGASVVGTADASDWWGDQPSPTWHRHHHRHHPSPAPSAPDPTEIPTEVASDPVPPTSTTPTTPGPTDTTTASDPASPSDPPTSSDPSDTGSSGAASSDPTSSDPGGGSSPAPVAKGCSADPGACGYPDADSTGIPDDVTLRTSGSVDADRDGQVIDGLDITGEINVTAKNVTVRNTRVTGGGDWVVVVRPGADGLVIEDSELQTPRGTPQDIACVLNIGDSRPSVLRTDIHGCSAGVSSGGGLVQDSYIHDMAQKEGLSHDVGVASNGTGGMRIVHNTIFNQYAQTAAIAFYQDFDVQRDNLVQGNLIGGGGYCIYGGTGTRGATSGIRILDNRFSRRYSPTCGAYGPVADFRLADPGNAFTGNFWDDTLTPLVE